MATRSGIPPAPDYAPFLKAAHISPRGKLGATATLVITRDPVRKRDGEFGEQFMLPVTLGKARYDFAIRVGSGNHHRLLKRFENKSPSGKLQVELKEYAGNVYIAIV